MAIKLNIPLPSKGLVVDRPAEYVDQRSASSTRNMEFYRGIIRKRAGSSPLGSSMAERCMRLFELQVGTQTRLVRVGLTKVEELIKSTSVWNDVKGTVTLTGSEDDPLSLAFPILTAEKIAVVTNGIDPIFKIGISGNAALLGGSPPLARFVRSFGPYLVLAYVVDGGNTYYNRVQWSDTDSPEVWSGVGTNAGSTNLLEDPDDITGLGIFGNFLTVHKTTSIYLGQLVTTSDVFRFDRKSTGVGCAAEATIANIPSGEQIFLGTDGIHLFNGITAPLIEAPIQDELRETINPNAIKRSIGMFIDDIDEYWVAVPIGSDTEPSTIYKYNWRTQQVYKDVRNDCTSMSLYLNTLSLTWDESVGTWDTQTGRWDSVTSLSLNKVVVYGYASGATEKRAVGIVTDGGAAIDSIWETKDFTATDFGIPDIDKMMRWKGLEVWASGNSVSIDYSIDGGESWTTATTLTLGSAQPSDSSPLQVYFDCVSSSLRLRFSCPGIGDTFSLKKYQIEATPRESRR
ncbi:MAG: hypothetical protein E6Q97_27110 [Desulfurellales bacterium]|nr:MAG: hypothetical protein E6Q97_27110 [Desulfurellales bacterium]